MLSIPFTAPNLGSEEGFTLIEMMVALVTGLVVTAAAFLLLQVTSEQTSRARDYVQASQLGRSAMTSIIDDLNSACVSENTVPVSSKSTTESIVFVTAFSKKTEVQPSEVQQHTIYWEKTAGETGTIYDTKALGESKNEAGEWVFKAAAKPVAIDANTQRVKNAKSGEKEIFRYYKYAEKTSEGGEEGLSALTPIALKSGQKLEAEAKNVAAVTVSFRSLPSDNSEKIGRDVDLSDQATFAFSAGFTEPTVTNTGACQNQ